MRMLVTLLLCCILLTACGSKETISEAPEEVNENPWTECANHVSAKEIVGFDFHVGVNKGNFEQYCIFVAADSKNFRIICRNYKKEVDREDPYFIHFEEVETLHFLKLPEYGDPFYPDGYTSIKHIEIDGVDVAFLMDGDTIQKTIWIKDGFEYSIYYEYGDYDLNSVTEIIRGTY